MKPTPEQAQAINESGSNIIVSAGAGSGKTAVLTERVMRILKSGIHINELLILTFTNAAAAEMKERIRREIKKQSANNEELKKELELIDQSYVTTFDSFALSIVKKYHYLLNISNNVCISEPTIITMQKSKIMDLIFDKYYESSNPKFQKLIYDFCVKDDQEIKDYILKIADKIDAMPNKEDYLNNYETNYLSDNFLNDCLQEYNDILSIEVDKLKKSAHKLSLYTDGDYSSKLDISLSSLYNSKDIDELLNNINLVKLPQLPRGSEEETKKQKDFLKLQIDALKKTINKYGIKDDIIKTFNNTKDYITIIIDIIKDYLEELHKYKEENELYDFQDIALLSIRILKENEKVRNELRDTFKEIMIDEYQDTNDIQETFIKMIENNNVYMVGDIKQSIYRFRNANPYIFKNKYDSYSQNINGLKIDLLKNFRSRDEVLKNINEIFDLIMDDSIGGAEYQVSHRMKFGNESYNEEGKTNQDYNMEILEYNAEESEWSKEEIEIFAIARDIQEKIKNHYQVFDKSKKILREAEYDDFVILMSNKKDFDLYKKIFEYLGIPLTLFRETKLTNSSDIYIIKNIIDLIIHMNESNYDISFKYDYTSIARSYLYGISDDEIFNTFKNNTFEDTKIFKDFKELSINLKSKSITMILDEIFKITDIYQKLITIGDIDSVIKRISYLSDIAINLSTLGYNIYTFRDYLQELLDNDYEIKYKDYNPNAKSVKIMSIHASKGLEYHVCYFSGLYYGFNLSDLNDRILFDNKYGIVTPIFNEGIKETYIKYLTKYHYIEEEISEKIRLFYVALTRAKEKMILLIPSSDQEKNELEANGVIDNSIRYKYRSFKDFIDSIKEYISKYYKELNIDNLNITDDYLYNNISSKQLANDIEDIIVNEINPIRETEINNAHFSKTQHELISKEIRNNMDFGLQMHESLEYIDFLNPDYSAIDNEFIKTKIKQFLSQDILSNINKSNIYKEYEFIYTEDNIEYHGIIDLMLEYSDKIDIIDYKLSNIDDPNYLKQLTGYKNYINKVTGKPVNIYLYSILHNNIKEL